jgi:hypothetical protein
VGTGVAGGLNMELWSILGLSSIALAVPCIGAGSFSNKNSERR